MPYGYRVNHYILPVISDQRSVNYNDEVVMARSFPIKTYANDGNRSISWEISFLIIDEANDPQKIINDIYNLQSCTYPQDFSFNDAPFSPPTVCRLVAGSLLGKNGICAVLRSYNMSYPTDVAWFWESGSGIKIPFYFRMSLQFEQVIATQNLPSAERIRIDGA